MPKILRAIWAPGEDPQFFFRAIFVLSNIVYTSGIEMSHHFQKPFGP